MSQLECIVIAQSSSKDKLLGKDKLLASAIPYKGLPLIDSPETPHNIAQAARNVFGGTYHDIDETVAAIEKYLRQAETVTLGQYGITLSEIDASGNVPR